MENGNEEPIKTPTISVSPTEILEGGKVTFKFTNGDAKEGTNYLISIEKDGGYPSETISIGTDHESYAFQTSGRVAGTYTAKVVVVDPNDQNNQVTPWSDPASFTVEARLKTIDVTLQHASGYPTNDQALWVAIRNRTNAISFARYQRFVNLIFHCDDDRYVSLGSVSKYFQDRIGDTAKKMGLADADVPLNVQGPYAYSLLKLATQVFLTLESGVVIRDGEWNGHKLFEATEEAYRLRDSAVSIAELNDKLKQYLQGSGNEVLPYLDRIVKALLATSANDPLEGLPYCNGVLRHRFSQPSLIELIWSYWHEEGMFAQTMNAIARRFQNQRSGPNDPLAELEIDPLRPLNNLIWGFVQDEHNRLSVRRRAFEYDHQYGLKLLGRAIPELRSADSRSKFIEAFHNLLYRTAVFYREDADTTVHADAFPLLNALKDVHLLLAEGAHNQYGDLPWTARAEMLTQQWLLARPEMREFLRGRHMVPYQEPWMGAVDAMKKLQGWTDTTITHFNELAVDGERLLLSIRFGDWSDLNNTEEQARNWARYWKPEIQRYLYGYLAVTGVDLMADITDNREAATRNLQPSMLLQRRLSAQARRPALSAQHARVAS